MRVAVDSHVLPAYGRPVYEELGRVVRQARERLGMEQGDLAARVGVGQQAASTWERGKSRPRRAMVRAVAATLQVDEEVLLDTDKKARDSLVLDLLEPVRPLVDAAILRLLGRRFFRASDFHETGQGACRLLPPLTHELAEHLPTYARAIAPIVEHVARTLASTSPGQIELRTPLTRSNTTRAQQPGARSARRSGRQRRKCHRRAGTAVRPWPSPDDNYARRAGRSAEPRSRPRPPGTAPPNWPSCDVREPTRATPPRPAHSAATPCPRASASNWRGRQPSPPPPS